MACRTGFTQNHRGESVAYIAVDGRITQGDGVTEFAYLLRETALVRPRILVDLEKALYIDSAGLAELVQGYSVARAHGGKLKLLRPRGRVDMLLRLTQLHQSFEIFEDEHEALASFT